MSKLCLLLQEFLEELNPFPDMDQNEIDNYLWARSSEIEKHCPDSQRKKAKEAERRWKTLDLRSPGIKQKNPPSHFSPFNPAFARSAHNHERTHGSTTGGESDSPATSPQHHGSRGGMSPTSQASTPKNSTPISPHASSADAEKIAVKYRWFGLIVRIVNEFIHHFLFPSSSFWRQ